jgi:hypothetical protein
MRPSAAATLAITLLALGAAGCGSKAAKDTLAKPELATQANAICKSYNARIEAIPQPNGQSGASAALEYYQQTRSVLDDTINQLATLKPDDAVKRDWQSYVASQRKAEQLLDDLVNQVKSRDPNVQRTLERISAAVDAGDAAAKRVGAADCVATRAAPS